MPWRFVFLVAALVLFILGALSVPVPRVNLVSAGLACLVIAMFFTA
jgi:hypothetical protein